MCRFPGKPWLHKLRRKAPRVSRHGLPVALSLLGVAGLLLHLRSLEPPASLRRLARDSHRGQRDEPLPCDGTRSGRSRSRTDGLCPGKKRSTVPAGPSNPLALGTTAARCVSRALQAPVEGMVVPAATQAAQGPIARLAQSSAAATRHQATQGHSDDRGPDACEGKTTVRGALSIARGQRGRALAGPAPGGQAVCVHSSASPGVATRPGAPAERLPCFAPFGLLPGEAGTPGSHPGHDLPASRGSSRAARLTRTAPAVPRAGPLACAQPPSSARAA